MAAVEQAVSPYLRKSKRRLAANCLSPEEYARVTRVTTDAEVRKLEKYIRKNVSSVDRTKYYRKQFFVWQDLRLHKTACVKSLLSFLFPVRLIFDEHLKLSISARFFFLFCFLLLVIHLILAVLCILSDVWILSAYEYLAPGGMYLLFATVYALQTSILSKKRPEEKWLARLDTIRCHCSRPEEGVGGPVLSAKNIIQAVMINSRQQDYGWGSPELFPAKSEDATGSLHHSSGQQNQDLDALTWPIFIPALFLSSLYSLSSPVYRGLHPSDHLYNNFPEPVDSPASWSLHNFLMTSNAVFGLLFYSAFLMELGISIRIIFRRLCLLKSFNFSTSAGASKMRGLPYLDLKRPDSILCWAEVRTYLIEHGHRQLLRFKIALAVMGTTVLLLGVAMLLRLMIGTPPSLFDFICLYHMLVLGSYTLITIVIGAEIDRVTRTHVRQLWHAQWKLEQARIGPLLLNDSLSTPERSRDTPTRLFRTRAAVEELPPSKGKASDIRYSSKDAQALLQRLSVILEKTDKPFSIFFVRISYGLLWKAASYLLISSFGTLRRILMFPKS